MKNGIDAPAKMIAEQQKESLVSSEMDPRTLAVVCVSMFNKMRILLSAPRTAPDAGCAAVNRISKNYFEACFQAARF